MKRTLFFLTAVTALLSFGSWISAPYEPAHYPGGIEAVDRYMNDSMHYPEAEKKAGKEGFVLVQFEVSDKGVAQNPVLTSLVGDTSSGFNSEVRRLVAAMPKWEAAKDKKGRPESSWHKTFVRFGLPDSLVKKPSFSGEMGEEIPRFPGGEAYFQLYLVNMIRYPTPEKEQGKDGTVYISFYVSATGAIENVTCKRGVPGAPGLEKEAIRVISLMPRWKPGVMAGKPVKVGMTVPVKFTLH